MNPLQAAIEKIAKAVHDLKNNSPPSQNTTALSEMGTVPFSQIEFSNGYPFSKSEIPFKNEFPDGKVMIQLIPVFQAITNTTHAFNVYEVTKTGFKLRMNVKNVANKGLLKELYYIATYMGESSND